MNTIIKLSNNQTWIFYYNNDNGICFSRLNSQGKVCDTSILSGNCPDDFDVICDSQDNIHLCCQNNVGDIIYYRCTNHYWNKTVLLHSKSNTTNNKQFKLFTVNNWISILYTLEYRNKNMLVHHIPQLSAQPTVIDYIGKAYAASCDVEGNIAIFYDSELNSAFGYKEYKLSQKSWSDFTPKPEFDRSDTVVSLFDNNNDLNVVFSKNKEVHYSDKHDNTLLSTGTRPLIHILNNMQVIQWNYKGKIHSAISRDGVSSWEKSGEYNIGNNYKLIDIYKISSNYPQIALKGEYIYGYMADNRVNLLGLNDFTNGVDDDTEEVIMSNVLEDNYYKDDNYETNRYEVNPHEINPHKVNPHEVNHHEINPNKVNHHEENHYEENHYEENHYQEMIKPQEAAPQEIDYSSIETTLANIENILEKIHLQISSHENSLLEIGRIIKELPIGSSKKSKFSR
ncbi:MAG: hypothetical protein PHE51_02435 [Eubacteriales bacterium]|nr:hypothetical protein [Eubacteriales bacterium]